MSLTQGSNNPTSAQRSAQEDMDGNDKDSENDEINPNFQSIKDSIFSAAKTGMPFLLFENLERLGRTDLANSVINEHFIDDNGQSITPFAAASLHGHVTCLKMMLEKFNPNLEIESVIKFDGQFVHGVTPLWCACSLGHLEAVKILIKSGAKANHITNNGSTPLRAACFIGRLDIVKYLVSHGGDFNVSNTFNNNCLMIASYKGFIDVVEFLLDNGVDSSQQANCGATALHYAADSNHVQVCELLLDHGAELLPNEFGYTPVIMAAERLRSQVVEMFLKRSNLLSLDEKIATLELIGASYANDKDQYSLSKAHYYLSLGMNMRYEDPNNVIRKSVLPPVSAYEDWIESQTIEELDAIRFNYNSMHMECLTIRERILGRHFPDLAHQIIFRGAVCADNGRFDRCESLWMHAMILRQMNGISVHKDLLRFAQVFSQMFHLNVPVKLTSIISTLKCCTLELLRNREQRLQDFRDVEILEEYETNITTTLYLITIATKILKDESKSQDKLELKEFQNVVTNIIEMHVRLRDGQTLLHLAVNSSTPVDDFHTDDVCRFPCVETVKLLLCCHANINLTDLSKNTPLHILILNISKRRNEDTETVMKNVEKLIKIFLYMGCHIDAVNSDGLTASQLCQSDDLRMLFRQYETKEMSLKCLSSRSIIQHKIPFEGVMHLHLEKFINLHSPTKYCQGSNM